MGIASFEIDGNAVREASKRTRIPYPTLSRIRKWALSHAQENSLPLDDASNWKICGPFINEGDRICSHITSTRENRDQPSSQHIGELNLDVFAPTVKQMMYKRGYAWRSHGWKTGLLAIHEEKIEKLLPSSTNQKFDYQRRAVFTDEVSVKKADRRMKDKAWRLAEEEYDEAHRKNGANRRICGRWASFGQGTAT